MKFEKGQKVRLDLHTDAGNRGVLENSHNNICVVIRANHPNYEVKESGYYWAVFAEMLKPLKEVQLLFKFMYD